MATRLRIQTKLFVVFIAVGLLSIGVGVFVPLRVISWLSPRQGKALLETTHQNFLRFYVELTQEPVEKIGKALNEWPEFVQAFKSGSSSVILQLLQQYAEENGYNFLTGIEGSPEIPTRWEPAKVRFVKVLNSPEDYAEWSSQLALKQEGGEEKVRLIPWQLRDRPYLLAGSVAPIYGSEGQVLGGLIVGRPLIRKDLREPGDPTYFYDNDFFTAQFEEFHDVSAQVIGVESQRFRAFVDATPMLKESLLDRRESTYLEKKISNVDSQILYVPLEDVSGNLVSVLYLHLPLPPETYAWKTLSETFYYGVAIAVLLAFVMALVVSRSISRPIKQLSEGALALSKGDLDYRVTVRTNDEVGDLAKIFMEMRRRLGHTLDQLQERARTIEEKNIALDRTLAEISRMRDFTEDILRSIDGGVITFNLAGEVTKLNRAARRLLQIPEGVEETKALQYIPETIVPAVGEVLKGGQIVEHSEMQIHRTDDSRVPVDLRISALKSAERTIGAVVTLYDLTQVQTLKEQIRRQEHLAALGTLSAGIAHEIRNPLGIIKGAAEILQKRFGNLKEEEGLSEFILEEVERLSSVVTDFLDFARPKEPNFTASDLNRVLRRSVQLANLSESHPRVEVVLDLYDALPALELDPDQCQQAFLNLILNAAQAMPQGGRLWVRSRLAEDSSEVQVEIADTGSGVEEAIRSMMFDPFFTTKDEGTGLGLSIVHRIIENHQARISLESAPGEGTTFRICFRVKPSESASRDGEDRGIDALSSFLNDSLKERNSR